MSSPSSISEQQAVSSVKNRKRPNTYDTAADLLPARKLKSISTARLASNDSPAFWDNLSRIWLTAHALREKDRRNSTRFPARASVGFSTPPTSLARFARRGGPDLRHLRGYNTKMGSGSSFVSPSRQTQSKETSSSPKAKRSSAYDKNFEQDLIDHNVYPKGYKYASDDLTPEPSNLDDIIGALAAPRASLSPSQFTRSTFKAFVLANDRVRSEGKVMSGILPTIYGDADIPNEGNLAFTNLDSITDETTVNAVPDLYDGVYPHDISKAVRQDLDKVIIPTRHGSAPVVPSFFLEAKAPHGGADVAQRQACLDGAIGARAMHSLQTYGEEPVYDGKARAFSSTYHAGTGTLQLYAHHITSPRAGQDRPEYHMTQLKAYALTSDRETFVQAATGLRNARDLARRQRESLIRTANVKASQKRPADGTKYAVEACGDDNTPSEPVIQSGTMAWQASHDYLQQQIANTFVDEVEYDGEAPTTP